MRKKLLTSAVKVRPQLVTTGRPIKIRNEKTTTRRGAKQSQVRRMKTSLKRTFKHKKPVRVQVAMMCWEILEGFLAEEPKEETSSQDGRADNEMEKPKYEEAQEEHVVHTQLTKNLDQRI